MSVGPSRNRDALVGQLPTVERDAGLLPEGEEGAGVLMVQLVCSRWPSVANITT